MEQLVASLDSALPQMVAKDAADERHRPAGDIVDPFRRTERSDPRLLPDVVTVTGAQDARAPSPRAPHGRRARVWAIASILVGSLSVASLAVIGARGRSALSPRPLPARCATSASCAQGAICRKDDGACVMLATDRCHAIAAPEDVTNDRTIWLGAMFPTTGTFASLLGIPDTHAVELARQEIAEVSHGIPGASFDAAPRPLGIVACDDAEGAAESARHLVDLRVPAVIGFASSDESVDLTSSFFLPARVLVVSVAIGTLVTQTPQPLDTPRLVWRVGPDSGQGVAVAAHIVSDLIEPQLKKAEPAERMRVAFIHPRATFALPIVESALAKLTFNGVTAIANGPSFRDMPLDMGLSQPPAEAERVVAALVEFAPHVILFVGEDELVDSLFMPVEGAWRRGPRPYYVSVTPLSGDGLFRAIGTSAQLRRRFFGVSPPTTSVANVQLVTSYNARFLPHTTLNDSPASAYDSVYLLAYAAFAAPEGPLTGSALAKGLLRLQPPGPVIDVGPTHIFEVIDRLRRHEAVDLSGITTRFDYDPVTGESTVDSVVQCIGVDASGAASDGIESGVRFDAKTGRLTGELRCP